MSRRSRFFSPSGGARAERPGFDVVRTPFGERFVERGAGFREAAKWAFVRLLGYAVLWASATGPCSGPGTSLLRCGSQIF